MGKSKKEAVADDSVADNGESQEMSYEEKIKYVNNIAKPMAPKKLTKKCYKLIKKARKHKEYLRCGLKEVQRRIRRGETGIAIFAGDVTPVEIMCHLPAVCENKNIPYCYIPSGTDIGGAMDLKRGVMMVLIREHGDYKDLYNELKEEISTLPVAL